MLAHVITAYLHFLGIMILMATLAAEHVTLQPQMTRLHLHRLAMIDLFYGMAAGLVFLTGLLRLAYFGKGIYFYLGNPLFYVKVGMFLAVALISIYPMMRFLAWRRKGLKQGDLPEIEPPTITRLRAVIRLELGVLSGIPLLAGPDGTWHWETLVGASCKPSLLLSLYNRQTLLPSPSHRVQ